MHIRILFVVAAFLMLIGMYWVPNRAKQTKLRRSQFWNASVCLIALGQLTRDMVLPVVFDIEHMFPFFWPLAVLWTVVGPVLWFRAPEDQIDPHVTDLRK